MNLEIRAFESLKNTPLLANLNFLELKKFQELANKIRIKKYNKNNFPIQDGTDDKFYYVINGAFKEVYNIGKNERQVYQDYIVDSQMFGEPFLNNDLKTSWVANKDCSKLAIFNCETLDNLFIEIPQIGKKLFYLSLNKSRRSHYMSILRNQQDSEDKFLMFLNFWKIQTRNNFNTDEDFSKCDYLNQDEISLFHKSTRETISRAKNSLNQKYGKLVFQNRKNLYISNDLNSILEKRGLKIKF